MAKPPRPSTVEKIRAKQAAAAAPVTTIDVADISNVLVAARRGMPAFNGQDLVNIATSIAKLEQVLQSQAQAEAAAKAPAALPSEPPLPGPGAKAAAP